MSEWKIWVCAWKRTRDGYRVWVKKQPKISGEGETFDQADEALAEEIAATGGDPENTREYDPPAPHSRRRERGQALVWLMGQSNTSLLNEAELTTDGICSLCEMPRGARNRTPARIGGVEGNRDGGRATRRRLPLSGFKRTTYFFSERFLRLLTANERASLELLPIEREGRGKKAFFEIVGAKVVLPLVTVVGAERESALRCEECERVFAGAHRAEAPPHSNVAHGALPKRMPPVLAFREPDGALRLGMTAARWAKLVDTAGAMSIASARVGVVEDDELVRKFTHRSMREHVEEQRAIRERDGTRDAAVKADREAQRPAEEARKAEEWRRTIAAAEAGDPQAQHEVARSLVGTGEEKEVEAFRLLTAAAAAGDPDATEQLAGFLAQGIGTPRNPDRAIAVLQSLAATHPAEAHLRLGFFYQEGIGAVRRDLAKAAHHFRIAASHGESTAAHLLASDRRLARFAKTKRSSR